MKLRAIITLLICGLLHTTLRAENGIQQIDTIPSKAVPNYLLPSIGGSLVLAGSLLDFDHGGSFLGMDFKPSFTYKADEVLRIVPAAALVGMKAFGIESRTEKWSELIVRSAASTAIMGVSVKGIKQLAGRVRPDGSDASSFPSGHTATAFLTASLFAKEYGHLNPWYSVGAYGIATSTAMLRRMGDHHWMSDVMVGAGVGILSVELGYALADIFYRQHASYSSLTKEQCGTSSAGVYMHYVLPHALSGNVNNHRIRSNFGYSVGMVANHFFTDYLVISGRMGITSSQIEVDGTTCIRPLDHVTITLGPSASLPLPHNFTLGTHIHGGYGFYPQADLAILQIQSSKGWGYDGGISLAYNTSNDVSIALSTNYQSWSAPILGIENKGLSIGLSTSWQW